MLFEPEQTWLHEVISERENRQTSSAVNRGQNMLCYNRGWVEQYVESENSEGKKIKIGF
ncbi:Hypothetical predicted protein [Paramuricea clavata]|uniref:Uncharacterized protein n=1 Tax=Paramuricea clavata TaxID=317549 RepID=A0A7D9IQQ2_PARCT|nr:Hypothetical predicted protein [Paramuricea clavata]